MDVVDIKVFSFVVGAHAPQWNMLYGHFVSDWNLKKKWEPQLFSVLTYVSPT